MEYLSTREAAERWGVSLRHVQRLLHENRIPGARKYGVSWLISADADKPADLRAAERTATAPVPGCSLFPSCISGRAIWPERSRHAAPMRSARS